MTKLCSAAVVLGVTMKPVRVIPKLRYLEPELLSRMFGTFSLPFAGDELPMATSKSIATIGSPGWKMSNPKAVVALQDAISEAAASSMVFLIVGLPSEVIRMVTGQKSRF